MDIVKYKLSLYVPPHPMTRSSLLSSDSGVTRLLRSLNPRHSNVVEL
jgi:hypothetical protein